MALLRAVCAACLLALALLAWWYPAPRMIRLEWVPWDTLHAENEAAAAGKPVRKSSYFRPKPQSMPLAEFIAAKTAGYSIPAVNPAWTPWFEQLEKERSVLFVRPSAPPFTELAPRMRYLELPGPGVPRHLEYHFLTPEDYARENIPAALVYPLRQYWPALLAAALAAFFLGAWPVRGRLERCSASRGVRWSAVLTVLAAAVALHPFLYQSESMSSHAFIFVGGFLFLGALIGLVMFFCQYLRARALFTGAHLAHFTYTQEEWTRFTHWAHQEESMQKKMLWMFISAIILVVGLGFMLLMRDTASLWVFAILMTLAAVLWVFAVGLPWLTRRRNLRETGEVYLGQNSVYLNGTVHSWDFMGARLESARLRHQPLPHILLVYSYRMMAGRIPYFFRHPVMVQIPVPAGQEQAARKILEQWRKN